MKQTLDQLMQASLVGKNFTSSDLNEFDCSKSPFTTCFYAYEDGEPYCIFCGEPEDRQ